MPGTIHLICGSTGAGKTTYATALADRLGALRFSIDEWMSALFWMDKPEPLEPAWAMERVDRCSRMIWRTAIEAATRGMSCLLETGLTTRATRTAAADQARAANLPCRLHFLDVDAAERWRRVRARNAAAGDTAQLAFALTREMFDFVEAMWEAPTDDELRALDGERIAG